MPKVSVIIPIYGVEKYIERCSRSLFEQTLEDIEFIFINDCTPDKSISLLRKVLDDYPNRKQCTRIVNMPTNSGLAAVRRHGIQEAIGEYYIACDSDDWVAPTMYQTMYEYAISNNCDLVHCDIALVDDDSKILRKYSYPNANINSDTLKRLIINGTISNSLCNKLVKNDVYKNEKIEFPLFNMDEDNVLSVQLAYFSKKLGYIPKAFYYAYQNKESVSRSSGRDKIFKRFNDSVVNNKIIVDFLERNCYKDKHAIFRAKYRPKMHLIPLLNESKYRSLWIKTFSEINWKLVFHSDFSLRNRILFLSVLCGFYPLIYMLHRIIKKGWSLFSNYEG